MTYRFPRLTVPLAIVTACFVLSIAPLCFAQAETDPLGDPVPETAKPIQELTDALTLFRSLDFAGAEEKLKEGVAKNPELPPAEVIMAQWFAQGQQPNGVRMYLERAVMNEPNDPSAYIFLGDFALREGRVTEASLLLGKAESLLGSFKNAKRKEQMVPQVANGLAAVAEARQDWTEAEKQLRIWLKAQPTSATAMNRLGRVLFMQKKAEEAWTQLKAAKEADPKILTPAATLARLYQQANDPVNAKKWMDYAVQSAPKDLPTRLVAAGWALTTAETQEQLERAKEEASQALQLDPKSLQAKVLRGAVALYQQDYGNAELYFDSAVKQSPNNFAAKNNLALALCEQADDAKKALAFEHAKANSTLYPKNTAAVSTLGWVLYKLGRKQEAEQVLRKAAAGQIAPDTAYYLARIYADFAEQAKAAGQDEPAKQLKEQSQKLLDQILKSKLLFSKRSDAEALQKELNR
ncbi:MAG TPA: tetratricopeptide repeat protein [Thermoguttaceae bacterium]|nr:tetratricopeptide repeat protein [Thermoguttaceae bacterium]